MSRMFPRMDSYIGLADGRKIWLDERTVDGAGAAAGLRAAFVSDVHATRNFCLEPLIECIVGCKPDIIFFGGDFADTREQALRLFEAFRALSAPLGIFAAPGNNDVEAFGSNAALAEAMEVFGGRLLVNGSVQAGPLAVGGVDELKYGRPVYDGLFAGRTGFRVLLSHYPSMPKADLPDLMLSGHTHGGQFNALGLTPYAIGFERVGGMSNRAPVMISGFGRVGGVRVLVSKGVGASRIPLRIGVRPEVHLLKFEC